MAMVTHYRQCHLFNIKVPKIENVNWIATSTAPLIASVVRGQRI